MVTIRLTNSKTRRKEDFVPLDPANVRIYVCGPTVYDRAHLGNARPVVVFDTLYRLLKYASKENGWGMVTYVRNFTDVDDKINAEALRRQKAGAPGTLEDLIRQRTEETIAWYHADMDALGALRPTHEPRATEYIGQMIAMIAGLIGSGHAYEANGHVLFRVRSYKDYGKLSGRSVDDMIAGARVEVAPFKEDPMDFVLWKPSSGEEPGWDSPWGRGRPGWHIECSAMSHELLGESFDIHGGGLDLAFPHHENEIAQSACAHPQGDFAHFWLHNEMLQVEGKKMSKSLGNFFTVRDLLDQAIPGEVIRFVLLMTHYRKPMDWTDEKRIEADATLRKWAMFSRGVPASSPDPQLVQALADDLNTAEALSILHSIYRAGDAGKLRASAQLVGLLSDVHEEWLEPPGFKDLYGELRYQLDPLIERLAKARSIRDFQTADLIRSTLVKHGVPVRITGDRVEYDLSMSNVAKARDTSASTHLLMGPAENHAAWLRDALRELSEALK